MDPSFAILRVCAYRGKTPMYNKVCNSCPLFMETCIPIVTSLDGYAGSSECDRYMCEGCGNTLCVYLYISLQ